MTYGNVTLRRRCCVVASGTECALAVGPGVWAFRVVGSIMSTEVGMAWRLTLPQTPTLPYTWVGIPYRRTVV
jgi:hypothetical protein